jgi:hypothetical protein
MIQHLSGNGKILHRKKYISFHLPLPRAECKMRKCTISYVIYYTVFLYILKGYFKNQCTGNIMNRGTYKNNTAEIQ